MSSINEFIDTHQGQETRYQTSGQAARAIYMVLRVSSTSRRLHFRNPRPWTRAGHGGATGLTAESAGHGVYVRFSVVEMEGQAHGAGSDGGLDPGHAERLQASFGDHRDDGRIPPRQTEPFAQRVRETEIVSMDR